MTSPVGRVAPATAPAAQPVFTRAVAITSGSSTSSGRPCHGLSSPTPARSATRACAAAWSASANDPRSRPMTIASANPSRFNRSAASCERGSSSASRIRRFAVAARSYQSSRTPISDRRSALAPPGNQFRFEETEDDVHQDTENGDDDDAHHHDVKALERASGEDHGAETVGRTDDLRGDQRAP